MTVQRFIARFLGALLATLVLDGLWLGLLMGSFYRSELGDLVLIDEQGGFAPRLLPTVIVYLLIPLGITLFTRPAHTISALTPPMIPSAIKGAVFGLVLYGTYDMTNWSLLAGWNATIAWIDTGWGVFLCAVASACASRAEGIRPR
jgi:uncharacterized membrane protein